MVLDNLEDQTPRGEQASNKSVVLPTDIAASSFTTSTASTFAATLTTVTSGISNVSTSNVLLPELPAYDGNQSLHARERSATRRRATTCVKTLEPFLRKDETEFTSDEADQLSSPQAAQRYTMGVQRVPRTHQCAQ